MDKMIQFKRILTTCLLCLGVTVLAAAQNATVHVSGQVVDQFGQPVAGAIVTFGNERTSVASDQEGRFSIDVPEKTDALIVRFLGMKTESVKPDFNETMEIVLKDDIHHMDEVLSLAQQLTTTREALTGAVAVAYGEELRRTPGSGFSGKLVGRLSGYTGLQSSNEPGWDGFTSFVRGRRSTNGNDPLIVIDGMPSPTTDLNIFDPDVIDNVVILKDAATTALYGIQGANGAILINTRRGQNGKTRFNASVDFSLSQPTAKPRMMESWEYATLRNQALTNDGLPTQFTTSDIQRYAAGGNVLYPSNDWYSMFVKSLAPTVKANVNVSGGNDRVHYFVSGTYLHQDGLMKTEKASNYNPAYKLDRFNVVSNMDVRITSTLSAFMNANVNIDRQNSPRDGGGNWALLYQTPAMVDGPLTSDGGVVATEYITSPLYGRLNRSGSTMETRSTINLNFGVNWDLDFITKGLSLKGVVGYETRYIGSLTGSRDYVRYIRDDIQSVTEPVYIPFGDNIDAPLTFGKGSNVRYFLNVMGQLNYRRIFGGKHSVEATLSYFNQDTRTESSDAQQMLPRDRIAFGVHAKYGYDSRYFLQFDGSYSASEQFAPNKRYTFYPSGSAAWVVSNEEFLKGNSVLTLLKLRGSYGMIGNDQIPSTRFLYKDNYRDGGGGYITYPVYSSFKIIEYLLGNPDLHSERSYQANVGLDLGLIDALTLRVDWYNQKTTDIIIQSPMVPDFQGRARSNMPYLNAGSVRNTGLEFELEYQKHFSRDIYLKVAGNLSTNHNTVLNVGELDKTANGYAYPYHTQGYSIGQSWGYLTDGFWNSQEEINASGLTFSGIQPRPGDLKYKDLNGDKTIDEKDYAPIGNPDVPTLGYGLSTEFQYKSFDVYLLFQGYGNRSLYVTGPGITETDARGVYTDIHADAWTPSNQNASYPALASTPSSSTAYCNDFFVQNRSYMRLKTAEIGYTLPAGFTRKIHLNKARVYLSGNNLLTFSKMKFSGIDPESYNLGSYPMYRTYNIGLNITF